MRSHSIVLALSLSLFACGVPVGEQDSALSLAGGPLCGCVFPGETFSFAACGEIACFEDRLYRCEDAAQVVDLGACPTLGEIAYEAPQEPVLRVDVGPSACAGDTGQCEGSTEASCEAKLGCTFLRNGRCAGEPVPCAERTDYTCGQFGGGCFLVEGLAVHVEAEGVIPERAQSFFEGPEFDVREALFDADTYESIDTQLVRDELEAHLPRPVEAPASSL